LILVEAGPTATKEYYENMIDYDYNPIDTVYIAECVSPVLQEEQLGPVFPNIENFSPYYSNVHTSAEPLEDSDS